MRLDYCTATDARFADELKDYASEYDLRIIRQYFADEIDGRQAVSTYALACDPAGEYYVVATDGDFFSSEQYPLYTNDLEVAATYFVDALPSIVG
jgi:hypothetical protein